MEDLSFSLSAYIRFVFDSAVPVENRRGSGLAVGNAVYRYDSHHSFPLFSHYSYCIGTYGSIPQVISSA